MSYAFGLLIKAFRSADLEFECELSESQPHPSPRSEVSVPHPSPRSEAPASASHDADLRAPIRRSRRRLVVTKSPSLANTPEDAPVRDAPVKTRALEDPAVENVSPPRVVV